MNKKNNNKGFTLVELIVVLVILAILAAILVPALLGYIDRAKEQQIVLNARSAYTAAQAELSSLYGKSKDVTKNPTLNDSAIISIAKTADIPADGKPSCVIYIKETSNHARYTVAAMKYTESSKTIIFDGESWDAEALPDGVKELGTVDLTKKE